MLRNAISALALLTACLSAHAATQSFAFEYSSPDWEHHFYGQFSADDLNGDGVYGLTELKTFRFNNFDWMPCSDWTTCTVRDFSYQPGGKVEFVAFWTNGTTTNAYYHFPSIPTEWAYYESFSFCDGPRCYYFEDFDYHSDNVTFAITNTTPVPEPASWLMLGAGLAVVGSVRRRRAAKRGAV